MAKVLVADTFTGNALAALRAAFPGQVEVTSTFSPLAEQLAETEYLLIRSRTKITPELIAQAPRLRLIVTATSGFDHIDLSACETRDIRVLFTPEANVTSVVELTFGLILTLFRRLNEMKPAIKSAKWKDDLSWGEELCGQHLGIVGLGRIGSRVAQVAKAFGMEVAALDPYVSDETFSRLGVERMGLMEILTSSDVLTLHVPYTKETHYLINHQTLPHMNPDAILVNTSRGPVVAETELVEALELKQLRGACLDVFEREPVVHTSKMLNMANVVMSCHVGAYTEQAFQRASAVAVKKVIDFHSTGEFSDSLPPPFPWYQPLPR
ncbi:MAG: phosphoglycerate dehydrogenase [Bdellovibrionaceae bacterium]|nr:phosphoglycerate dehydrogenase [Bdellovibrionales bacterium]MCB9085916.1 phosphoglycerate dehydrogenase [Pseudobdellovibrionaceae bacterium]